MTAIQLTVPRAASSSASSGSSSFATPGPSPRTAPSTAPGTPPRTPWHRPAGRAFARLRACIRRPGARRSALIWVIVALLAALACASVAGFIDGLRKQHEQTRLLHRTREVRRMAMAMSDAQATLSGYLLTGATSYLQPCYAAMAVLRTPPAAALRMLDADRAAPGNQGAAPPSVQIAELLSLWTDILAEAVPHRQRAIDMLSHHASQAEALRAAIVGVVDQRLAKWDSAHAALDAEQDAMLIVQLLAAMLTACGLVLALRRGSAEAARREAAMVQALHAREEAIAGREEVRQVFAMAEALQSADGMTDGAAILRASAARMMPRVGGALYVFNTARDRLDLAAAWDPADAPIEDGPHPQPAEFLLPQECWALKRSKPHLNGAGPGALRCCHTAPECSTLEVPMSGRGEPVGLFVLSTTGPEAALERLQDRACVLAESMSLALSSIMLREKLRNQAVRDGLTGLYNRRFLEEVMQNLVSQSQRRHACLSAIMIDLDHFKQLNDTHGHAAGDSVLKATGAALRATLRTSDIACRYGGEELLVLMPDCTLDMARGKAEQIRDRIARLSREGGPVVTASLGVASFPACARDADELLAAADEALYRSKQTGRNRATTAPPLAHPPIPPTPLLSAQGIRLPPGDNVAAFHAHADNVAAFQTHADNVAALHPHGDHIAAFQTHSDHVAALRS